MSVEMPDGIDHKNRQPPYQEKRDARMDYLVCADGFRRGSHGIRWRPVRRLSENGRAIVLRSLPVRAADPLCPRRRKVTARRHV